MEINENEFKGLLTQIKSLKRDLSIIEAKYVGICDHLSLLNSFIIENKLQIPYEETYLGLVTINKKQGHHYPCFVFNEFVDLKKSDMGYFFKFYIDFSKGIYAEEGKKIQTKRKLKQKEYHDDLMFISSIENRKKIYKKIHILTINNHYASETISIGAEGCAFNCKVIDVVDKKIFFSCENSLTV